MVSQAELAWDIELKVVGSYCLFLVIVGTLSNLIALYICLRKRLRSVTTFIFFSFILLNDTLSLYGWCLDHFLDSFFHLQIEESSIWLCKIFRFSQFVTLQWSSWLLVFLTLDRYLSITIKTWRSLYFRVNQAIMASILLGFFIMVLNSHMLILAGEQKDGIVNCYGLDGFKEWTHIWSKVHAFTYSFVPSLALIVINSFVAYNALKKTTKINPKSGQFILKKKRLSLAIGVVTFGFMIGTIPSAVVSGFANTSKSVPASSKLILFICDSVSFTYHSCKFQILVKFNSNFRQEFRTLLSEIYARIHQVRSLITKRHSPSHQQPHPKIQTTSNSITDYSS
nr:G protein-coupled receptor [Proales similis]